MTPRVLVIHWILGALVVAVLLIVAAASRSAPDSRALAGDGIGQTLAGAPLHQAVRGRLGGTSSGVPQPAVTVSAVFSPAGTFSGYAGWSVPALGPSYLAMRLPRGTVVTITGPGGSWTTRVTDYGPSSRISPPRIADIAVGHAATRTSPATGWQLVCGLSPRYGLCFVTVTTGAATPTAPPTDVGP